MSGPRPARAAGTSRRVPACRPSLRPFQRARTRPSGCARRPRSAHAVLLARPLAQHRAARVHAEAHLGAPHAGRAAERREERAVVTIEDPAAVVGRGVDPDGLDRGAFELEHLRERECPRRGGEQSHPRVRSRLRAASGGSYAQGPGCLRPSLDGGRRSSSPRGYARWCVSTPLARAGSGACSTRRSPCTATDHTHILVSIKPDVAISDLVRDIKANSSSFIKEKNLVSDSFSWQEGFGAFSYSKSQAPVLVKYILNQPEHHSKKTFKEEYLDFLNELEIEYNEKYLFEFYD